MQQDYKRSGLKASEGRLEEVYLNYCRKQKVPLDLKTAQGETYLSGFIVGFDNDSLIVEVNGSQELVYKAGIASICPRSEMDFIFNDAWRENKSREMAARGNYCYN